MTDKEPTRVDRTLDWFKNHPVTSVIILGCIFVTGLGPTSPSVGTGSLPVPGTDALVTGSVIVGVQNAGARVVTSRLAPNLIGVAEVAFQVPSDAPTGNDVVLNVVVNVPGDSQTSRYSNGTKIPIQ